MSEWIHTTAKIGKSVQMGHNAVIGENVQIGHHVVIHPDTIIGNNIRIDDHAVLGKNPMRSTAIAIKQSEHLPPLQIGEDTMIGTGAVLYRGARIGNKCLIADYASVREESSVGDVTIIGRSSVVENKVTIGKHCKVETNVFVPAFSEIGNHCFIAPHVVFTNDNFMGRTEERKKHFKGVTIQDGGRLGANSTILPGVTIQTDGVAGAGAVVTHDIPSQQMVVGVPAKHFKQVSSEQLLNIDNG